MLTFYEKYNRNIYSQNGEDGIIDEIFYRLRHHLSEPLTAVEFGAPSWDYCSNTAALASKKFTIRMFDINENPDPRIELKKITPDNVNDIFECPDVLSIDVDNDDYHIWKAYRGKPAIVIIEINSSILPPAEVVPGDHGASFMAMLKLGISKGYFLVCHTGNMIFVDKDHSNLFPEINWDPVINHERYFNKSFL